MSGIAVRFCIVCVATFGLCSLLAPGEASAQDPRPPANAVDVSDFDGAEADDPSAPQALKLTLDGGLGGYASTMLGASLNLQYLQITQRGRKVRFWGGRIVSLENDSPLHDIGLQLGDVITRLDGRSVANKASRTRKSEPYRLPQTDRHYGPTKVRFIFRATEDVQEQTVDLGNLRKNPGRKPSGPTPLAP